MAERPILFSGPMVRALLAGTKTQTRRPLYVLTNIKRRGDAICFDRRYEPPLTGPSYTGVGECWTLSRWHKAQPGDRLWVRETFSGSIAYERHGYPLREWGNKVWYWADGNPVRGDWTRPRPSIHMPRHLSRITLEVTDVRIERLKDISEEDAMAEGCHADKGVRGDDDIAVYETCRLWQRRTGLLGPPASMPRARYAVLWESINGPGAWASNPWVSVITFKRVTP